MFPNEHITRIFEATNRAFARLDEAGRQFAEWNERLAEPLQKFSQWRQQIQPHLSRLAEVARLIEEVPPLLLIGSFTFARGGWHDAPLLNVPASELLELVHELIDKSDEEVTAKLDHAIPELFRRYDHAALWDMVDRWDAYPGWRRQVFEEAFWAHKNEKYVLSVSALAPQIEGILRYETGEYSPGTKWIKKLNKALDFEYDRSEPPPAPTAEDFGRAIDELRTKGWVDRYHTAERVSLRLALLRVNELYNDADFSAPQPVNATNRHAIAHGVSGNFSEVTSIKLFCAVQLVHEIVLAYQEALED
jgi:hypothetical protein